MSTRNGKSLVLILPADTGKERKKQIARAIEPGNKRRRIRTSKGNPLAMIQNLVCTDVT